MAKIAAKVIAAVRKRFIVFSLLEGGEDSRIVEGSR
jgi:hypothetical protein